MKTIVGHFARFLLTVDVGKYRELSYLNWIGQVGLLLTCLLDDFFGEEKVRWFSSKNKVDGENLHFQRHINFLIKLQCLFLELLFI